jgi:hypothetical protein
MARRLVAAKGECERKKRRVALLECRRSSAKLRPVFRHFFLRLFALLLLCTGPCAFAWGPMHSAITEAAFDALPEWQRTIFAAQRTTMIEFDCFIPDLMRAAANRKTLANFLTLPNGDPFTHEPHSRHHNYDQILHYFSKAVEQVRAGELDEASRWAGCVLHFIEDCGSPAHSIPGDNQHGLMQDLLQVPEAYRHRPLHGLIESGTLKLDLAGYQPKLLGTTPPEAATNLVERLNFAVRNARSQLIPILQGVFQNDEAAVDEGRRRAATVDAQVCADMLYTLLCIAQNRFEDAEKAALERIDVTTLTPLEMVSQSYFPQFTYYSNPFFGFPTPNAILKEGTEKQPLALQVMEQGTATEKRFDRGLGVGTHTRLTYAFPMKVYDRFTCLVGLHATLGVSGAVVVRVYTDGTAVFDSGVLTGTDTARPIDLSLENVQQLAIDVEARPPLKAGTNYAVIAEPVLHKATGPMKNPLQKVP